MASKKSKVFRDINSRKRLEKEYIARALKEKLSLSNEDEKVIKMLVVSGHCTKEQITTFIGRDKIAKLISLKVLELKFERYRDIQHSGYCLGSAGSAYAEKILGATDIYKRQSVFHDIQIAEKYLSIPEDLRDRIYTEAQSRRVVLEIVKSRGEKFLASFLAAVEKGSASSVDMIYTDADGELVAFEVYTKWYKTSMKEAKQNFAHAGGLFLEIKEV